MLKFEYMEAQTSTGFSFDMECRIWGYSFWGANEFSAHVAEGYDFELLCGSRWDWHPRKGEVSTINGDPIPDWWRLPYVVQEFAKELLEEGCMIEFLGELHDEVFGLEHKGQVVIVENGDEWEGSIDVESVPRQMNFVLKQDGHTRGHIKVDGVAHDEEGYHIHFIGTSMLRRI